MKYLPILTFLFTLNLGLSLLILFLPNFLPTKLPLFYSLPWGEQQLAQRQQFLIVPAISLSISLANLLVIRQLHNQQILLKTILQATSIICSLVLSLTLIKIIWIFI